MKSIQLIALQALTVIGVFGFIFGNEGLFLIGSIAGAVSIFQLRGTIYPRTSLFLFSVGISFAISFFRNLLMAGKFNPGIFLFLCMYPIVIWVYRSIGARERP